MSKLPRYAAYAAKVLIILVVAAYAGQWIGVVMQKQSSKNFTLSAVRDISKEWNPAELDKRIHPVLIEGLKKANQSTVGYFTLLKKLGTLKSSECELLNMASVIAPVQYTSGVYRCAMVYDTGPSTLIVEVRRDNAMGDWKIATLSVDSAFLQKQIQK